MSFTKFVALMTDKTLFFTRADCFEDPFEGTQTRRSAEARSLASNAVRRRRNMPAGFGVLLEGAKRSVSVRRRQEVAISCWHMQNSESAAMWSLYARMSEGVAVRTTYRLLRESLVDTRQIHLGRVTYLDYATDDFESRDELEPFVSKRREFEHEKEVRALLLLEGEGAATVSEPFNTDWRPSIQGGIPVSVDLVRLVEAVYVPPNAPSWFVKLVTNVVCRMGFGFSVKHSDLGSKPIY